jgi:serine/threonine protein phosphatase PrpC
LADTITVETTLFVGARMTEPETVPTAGGLAIAYSHPSPEHAAPDAGGAANEDAATVMSLGAARGMLAIADGMGGHRLGGEAAKLTLETLARSVQTAVAEGTVEQHPAAGLSALDDQQPRRKPARGTEGGVLREPILTGFETANRAVTALGTGAGTTLAVVEIDDSCLRTYHAGDSMILVVGQRGKVKHRTVPHSPVGYAVEAGVLGEEEAIEHDERHIVSNIVGSADMRIELGPVIRMRPRDTLLLSTDGLFDNLRLDEITEIIRKGPLRRSAERLAAGAQKRMREPDTGEPSKPDDLTFVLFRLNC